MNALCSADCPFVVSAREFRQFPVGQLHRVAPLSHRSASVRNLAGASASPPADPEVDETKRNVLKLLAVAGIVGAAGGGLTGGAVQFAAPPQVGLTSFPEVALLDLDGSPLTATKTMAEYSYLTADVITFNYPLRNEPNFLLNLAAPPGSSGGSENVVGGVGPKKSIVAFSAICQHLGCPAPALNYFPPGACSETFNGLPYYLHCTCHGSTYDVTNGAAVLTGPAVLPLPQVQLEWRSDDTLWAIGESGPPVNGHLDTLTGDYGVGSQSALTKQTRVQLCNF
jgi:Rieske Fe-S protein